MFRPGLQGGGRGSRCGAGYLISNGQGCAIVRDFLRSIGGLLYGVAVLIGIGLLLALAWLALGWMAGA